MSSFPIGHKGFTLDWLCYLLWYLIGFVKQSRKCEVSYKQEQQNITSIMELHLRHWFETRIDGYDLYNGDISEALDYRQGWKDDAITEAWCRQESMNGLLCAKNAQNMYFYNSASII